MELKITEESKNPHFIYFKEHSIREQNEDKPSGRTLFLVNIPPYADENGIKNAFTEAGKITSVKLMLKPTNMPEEFLKFMPEPPKPAFRIGYIVFSKVSELDTALKLKKLQPMNNSNHKVKYGMAKWINEFNSNIHQTIVLKKKVQLFMDRADRTMLKTAARFKKLEEEDDEGWMTVTRGGKVSSFARSEKVQDKIMAKEESGRKRKELKNFYSFQIRESKKNHVVALRQKFEQDKRKIAQIKESRRFKPF